LDNFFFDFRYALRMLRKSPLFTLAMVCMLALGIGANAAIFTIFRAVLLRPLPYASPERLMQVWETRRSGNFTQMESSYPDYVDLRDHNQVFEELGGYSRTSVTFAGPEGAEEVTAPVISANFLSTLGVQPALGRGFRPSEDTASAERTVVLSYGGWQRRFGGDPKIIGRVITVDGEPCTIIGVLPKEFYFAPARGADFWLPLHIQGPFLRRNLHWFHPLGRLKPGISMEQAQANLAAVSRQLEQEYPDSNTGVGVRLISLRDQLVGSARPVLALVMSGVGFILLITCANVAGLLLAKSVARQKEISIRAALGAGRGRIVTQLLTESLALAAIGGMLGLIVAQWTVPAITVTIPKDVLREMPLMDGLGIDSGVLLFSFAVTLLTGLIFGLLPAFQVFQSHVSAGLQESSRTSASRSRHRIRRMLVVTEISMAVVLLVSAGLLMKSLLRVMSVDPGFDTQNLLTMQLALPDKKYHEDPQVIAYTRNLISRLSSLPGVKGVATVSVVPLSGGGNTSLFDLEGFPKASGGAEYEANTRTISPNYFDVMRIPLRRGRFFNAEDIAGKTHVVVISQSLADQVYPGQDPIGKRINFTYTKDPNLWQIVGVVGNENVTSLDAPLTPVVYQSFEQDAVSYPGVIIRAGTTASALAGEIRREVRSIDSDVPIFNLATMRDMVSDSPSMFLHSFPAYLVGAFASLALLLAAVGIYGLLAYSVAQRTRELGIRMALGAQRNDLLRLVLMDGVKLTGIGAVIGILAALISSHAIASLLFGVKPLDALTFFGVPLLLGSIALLASYWPARRAASIDPMVALRHE